MQGDSREERVHPATDALFLEKVHDKRADRKIR